MGQQEPLPVGQQEPLPVGQQEPLPVGQQEPLPVGQQEPLPVGQQEPLAVGQQEPSLVSSSNLLARIAILYTFLLPSHSDVLKELSHGSPHTHRKIDNDIHRAVKAYTRVQAGNKM